MAQGTCGLCLETADIQKSHLVPAAMYRNASDHNRGQPNVEKVDKQGHRRVVRQVFAPLLCLKCEGRISKGGENWMMRQIWNGSTQRFPLLERLNLALT